METTTVYDGAGRPVNILKYKGYRWAKDLFSLLSASRIDLLESIRTMKTRDDDVFVCNYAKTGTHWIWEIVSMVVRGKAEYEKMSKQIGMLELRTLEEIEQLHSPRVINTHFAVDLLPDEVLKKRRKVVHVQRNPKDVAVSWYHMSRIVSEYPGTFEEYYPLVFGEQRMMDCWFEYELEWEKLCRERSDLPIFNLCFEDMKENPVREVQRIAEFLEVPLSQQIIEDIALKCTFKNLKTANEEFKTDLLKIMTGKSFIYRKGVVGDWKNSFTVALNERFDQMFQEKMKTSYLKFRFEI